MKIFIANIIRSASKIFFEEFANVYAARNMGNKVINKANHLDYLMLNTLRNRHLGNRCFILGNGPSLSLKDINRLKNEYTFASNKIYLIYGDTTWRPTFYSAEDPLLVKNVSYEISKLQQSTKLFPEHMLQFIQRDINTHFIPFIPQLNKLDKRHNEEDRAFSLDLTNGINWGSTITYSMIQMAVFMGFKRIYLIGVDHSYVKPKKMNGNKYICEGEVNHFHKDYRMIGEEWNDPKVTTLERSYEYAENVCKEIGVKIYNASRKTQLDVFEKINFDDIENI